MLAADRSVVAPHAVPTDLELVARVRTGDAEAREALVRTHVAAMLATAGRILGAHEHEAGAAVRDAFTWAFESLARYDGTQPLSRWLHRASVRAAVARCPAPAYEAVIDAWLPVFDDTAHREHVRGAWIPEPGLDRHAAAMVRRLIATLPDELRLALILRDVEGLPTDEAAAVLRTSPAAVSRRLHRARMALRHLLERNLVGG
jgi:RNA polymerase sigma-70 factor (ECF subfamily)